MDKKTIVTHHAPDLDAISGCWLLKEFDTQHFGDAQFAFVNPGDQLSLSQIAKLNTNSNNITYVDTGLIDFDHHQLEDSHSNISATSLVYNHICQVHPELMQDKALQALVDFVTDVDHFGEILWPETNHPRYNFMLHQIIRGLEFIELHDDHSQLYFGFTCLQGTYSILKQYFSGLDEIEQKGQYFTIQAGKCMAIETKNDETMKLAQKKGIVLVIRKDPQRNHIRIKARPDSNLELKPLYQKILTVDPMATWYYHQSGKMLINGSRKHDNQKPSSLELETVIQLIKKLYG